MGLAIATHLAAGGATVVVADVDENALAALPEPLEAVRADVTIPEEVRSLVERMVERHGRVNILVNNAGTIYSEPFVNILKQPDMMHGYESFRRFITLNLDTVFLVTAAVVHQMVLKRTKGIIVNISSISAAGNAGQTAYSAAKAGVEAMTVTWSKELAAIGIRCNAVAPGYIDTKSTRQALKEATLNHVVSNTPLRRLGDALEIAKAVSALVENDFINGEVLKVNGGLTI